MKLHETHVCRDCGAEITLPYVRAALAATPEPTLDAEIDAAVDDVSYAGASGYEDYWVGFNDGISKIAARLHERTEPQEPGS